MDQSADEQPLGDLIDPDLPAEELERLARVHALLRVAAARDRDRESPFRLPPPSC